MFEYSYRIDLEDFEDSEHTDGIHTETDKMFTGKLELDAGASYRILTVAYNASRYDDNTVIGGMNGSFQVEGSSLIDTQIKLTSIRTVKLKKPTGKKDDPNPEVVPDGSEDLNKIYEFYELHTLEFFVGYLYTEGQTHEQSIYGSISGIGESIRLTGQLYCGVGCVDINLTGLPEDVKEVYLVPSFFPMKNYIYNNEYINELKAVSKEKKLIDAFRLPVQ